MEYLSHILDHLIFSVPFCISIVLLIFAAFGGDVDADVDIEFDAFSLGSVPKLLLLALFLLFFALISAWVDITFTLALIWFTLIGTVGSTILVIICAKPLSWLFRDWGKPSSIKTLLGKPVTVQKTFSSFTGKGVVTKADGSLMSINIKYEPVQKGKITLLSNVDFFIYGFDDTTNMYIVDTQ